MGRHANAPFTVADAQRVREKLNQAIENLNVFVAEMERLSVETSRLSAPNSPQKSNELPWKFG